MEFPVNGEPAIQMAIDNNYDAVLMDMIFVMVLTVSIFSKR